MTIAASAENEVARIETLHSYAVLDTAPEPAFDNLTSLAAAIAETPIALVSLVDSDRQWFKSRKGLDVLETPREVAFCNYTIREDGPLIVEDATQDDRFKDNPLVVEGEKIRFYAGFALRSWNGHSLGSLCVIDRQPRTISSKQVDILAALATQAQDHLELRRMRQEAQEDASTRRELLNHLDREFFTTLSGIVSAQQHLASTELNAEQETYLAFSNQATDHLVFLVDHLKTLLSFGRSEA